MCVCVYTSIIGGGDEDDLDFGRPFTMNFGPSLHMPVFGMDSRESDPREYDMGHTFWRNQTFYCDAILCIRHHTQRYRHVT